MGTSQLTHCTIACCATFQFANYFLKNTNITTIICQLSMGAFLYSDTAYCFALNLLVCMSICSKIWTIRYTVMGYKNPPNVMNERCFCNVSKGQYLLCLNIAFSIFDWVKPWIGLKNQLSNFTISFVYIWSTLQKKSSAENVRMCVCACVCACVCVCVSCQFFVAR